MVSGNDSDGGEGDTVIRYGDEYYTGEDPPQQTSLVNLDRDRGILTPADRRLLVGVSDLEPGSTSERKARQRIRERIRDSMRDYYLLLNYLEERDLKQAFGKNTDGGWTILDDVIAVYPAALGFLYAAMTANPDDDIEMFEHRLAAGISAAEEARNGEIVDVEVDIDISRRREVDQLVSMAREEGADAEEITPGIMNRLFQHEHIEKDLYADIMEDLLQDDTDEE